MRWLCVGLVATAVAGECSGAELPAWTPAIRPDHPRLFFNRDTWPAVAARAAGPEAPALLRLAAEEGPDVAVSLHSHEGVPAVLRPAYVPMAIQQAIRALAEALGALLQARGLPAGAPPPVSPEEAVPPAPFNLTSALYHVCGALSLTVECPHGLVGPRACPVDMATILDIQLTLYEAVLAFALDHGTAAR